MKKWVKQLNGKEFNKMCVIGKAASKLFDENGYLETSLKDISIAAKISKGGIYHYFSNKHEILYFVLDNYMDLLLGGLEEELKEMADNDSKIQFIMFRHLKLYNRNVPEAKALLIEAHNLPSKYFKAIAEKERKYAQILIDLLSDYFDGSMQIDKLKAISFTLFGMFNSIMYWYDPKGPVTLEELSKIVYDIFLKGVSCYRVNLEKV
jgi:TetR/AcrR family transcriptional regulator, cholesterol catabolism regulator